MPSLNDLRSRFSAHPVATAHSLETHDAETLVCDNRGHLTPKQHVESKLRRALTQMEQREALAHAGWSGR